MKTETEKQAEESLALRKRLLAVEKDIEGFKNGMAIVFIVIIAILFIGAVSGCSTAPHSGTVTAKRISNPIRFQGHKVPADYQETQTVYWITTEQGTFHVTEAEFDSVTVGETYPKGGV